MDLKRVWQGLSIAFLVFFVVKYPDQAASTVRSIGVGIGNGFDKIVQFFQSL
ncbi:MAG: hypothetical protein LBQ06_01320 [Frankiaceae bacterium]|jgi:hypothetical protein|nr:hypothetical protein [Frankiaceae bacterium]